VNLASVATVDPTNDQGVSMIVRTRIYHFNVVKQSSAVTVDLTSNQGVSKIMRTRTYYFEAVKQASAATVDLWITSRWVAGTVMWSHLF
jgi:ribosomal protein S2